MKNINLKLIEKIRKPVKGNKYLNSILSILIIIFYPIILIAGLIIILNAAIISGYQNLTMSKVEKEKIKAQLTTGEHNEKWNLWTTINELKIFQKLKGEIRFGPIYLNLKSDPTIPYFNENIFGDWFFQYKKGLFLQKWNSTVTADTDLLFLDTETLKIETIKKNIPAILWDIVEIKDNTLQLRCDNGKEVLTFNLSI